VKRKILIASFLKPVNDIRSYEKIAKSLASNSTNEVYCIGYPSNIELSDNKIKLLPLSYFNKSGFGRLRARWEAFKLYVKVKPEVIIVNSPDLLFVTCTYKILFGAKIIYDIRENYFRNLWFQKNYFWGLRHALALLVRTKEVFLSPLFTHFILAEKVYKQQLSFIGRRHTIIENKSLPPKINRTPAKKPDSLTFLISGTIAYEYGIIEGVYFYKNVVQFLPNSSLKIIGHCPNKTLYNNLKILANENTQINLKISSNPVAHVKIEEAILEADFGLLPYQNNKSFSGKWPTKIFEYMAHQLPIIIQKNKTWNTFIEDNNAGISINFLKLESLDMSTFFKKEFYNNPLPNSIYWTSLEAKLTSVIEGCFEK